MTAPWAVVDDPRIADAEDLLLGRDVHADDHTNGWQDGADEYERRLWRAMGES